MMQFQSKSKVLRIGHVFSGVSPMVRAGEDPCPHSSCQAEKGNSPFPPFCVLVMLLGEGSGPPLQYSCLENPMDGGAWQAAVHGVAKSRARRHFHFHFSLSCIGEGNGNPLQCSCLENPRDRGAWWAAISGVAQSQTRLRQLSSSSSSSHASQSMR